MARPHRCLGRHSVHALPGSPEAGAASPRDCLANLASHYTPGDTDFSWTRATPWRSLLAATLVVNAWGRYSGGLLVAPALALLFLMNVFPLLWSFGLSFFSYRANRARAPTWVGLENYAKVLSDPDIWDRLHGIKVKNIPNYE